MVQILALIVRTKLDQLLAIKRMTVLENEVINIVNIAGQLTNQRSQADLIKYAKITIPPFFGFEGASLLLRDTKNNLLYTMNEINKDTDETDMLSKKYDCSEQIAPEMRKTVRVTYPNNSGISGKVFH